MAKRDSKITGKDPGRIRLLLADDNPVVRKGIQLCLARHPRLEIVGEAADGREAVAKAKEFEPDVLLMDFDMPELSGLAVTELLAKELPAVKVLILSMHGNSDHVLPILKSGARGYVLKNAPPEELIKAIETVYGGETYFSEEVARTALTGMLASNGRAEAAHQLSDREREVLIQIAEGLSNKEIASRLGLGVRTVETHRERIMQKLNIHSVAGLTRFAIAKGLVTLPNT